MPWPTLNIFKVDHAQANHNIFYILLQEDADGSTCTPYLNQWIYYEELALDKEKKEMNLKVNKRRKSCAKSNYRKL